jgi:predicted SAM-dependent methyltransferase
MSTTTAPKAEYLAESPPTRLNWGCGAHLAAGWINSDVKAEPGVDLVADIRRGLPLDSDSVDYAVSVHALPELAYPELVPALAELRRVLKPEGTLRLVLPDFDRAVAAYRAGDGDYFKVPPEEMKSIGGRFLVHSLWFGYSRSLFTLDFTEELLARAGFERIQACDFKRTASPFGRIVELDNREEESFYVEARKPRADPRRGLLPYTFSVAGDGLEIVDIVPDPGEGVRGHFRVRKEDGRRIEIVGWVLGRESAATQVEVRAEGSVAGRAPVAVDRPDVAESFPDVEEAATAGFRLELMAAGRGRSQLEVWAVLADDSREPLGRITVESGRRGLLDAVRRG